MRKLLKSTAADYASYIRSMERAWDGCKRSHNETGLCWLRGEAKRLLELGRLTAENAKRFGL
jgi:hypothetical protein